MSNKYLKSLLGMLDDPSEKSAECVMGELLKHDQEELWEALREVQESDDPLVRKRVQQLAAIMGMRTYRKSFHRWQSKEDCDNLVWGLVELHTLWFEMDGPEELGGMMRDFLKEVDDASVDSIEKLSKFMFGKGFALPQEEERLDPDFFCLGVILCDFIGADVMLCALGQIAGIAAGLQLLLVKSADRFMLVDAQNSVIAPDNDWQVEYNVQFGDDLVLYNMQNVIQYAALMMFSYAVASDNFRAVHTIGHAMCGGNSNTTLDFLPGPYNGKTQETEKQ